MNRLRSGLRSIAEDVPVLTSVGLVTYGSSNLPAPWGAVVAPIVLGVGLFLAWRYGSA